jgi:hypothetical protein
MYIYTYIYIHIYIYTTTYIPVSVLTALLTTVFLYVCPLIHFSYINTCIYFKSIIYVCIYISIYIPSSVLTALLTHAFLYVCPLIGPVTPISNNCYNIRHVNVCIYIYLYLYIYIYTLHQYNKLFQTNVYVCAYTHTGIYVIKSIFILFIYPVLVH